MDIERDLLAIVVFASVTWIAKSNVQKIEGIPEISPVDLFKVNPSGKAPEIIDQLYGAAPPRAFTVWLYEVSTVPQVSASVFILSGSAVCRYLIMSQS